MITNSLYHEIASKIFFFFSEFKTENLTEMEGSNNIHPEQIMVSGEILSSLLTAEFNEFSYPAPR